MQSGGFKSLTLLGVLLFATACSKGGKLTLEPGVRLKAKSSPFVQVNQGGKALVWTQGLPEAQASTDVHGWVTVQTVSASKLDGGGGHTAVINKISAKK